MPATPTPRCNHLSASSIASFKACSQRYRLAYVEGIRPDRDTDSQRTGTDWHSCHEVYAHATGDHEAKLAAVISHLNTRYSDVPSWKTPQEFALEREILLVSFVGYCWYWSQDQFEVVATELPFDLPLHEPRTGMPCSTESVKRVGKIDMVIRRDGGIAALERKSTSKSVTPESVFWEKWRKDSQVSMYSLAFVDMRASGQLPFEVREDERFGNTLIDAWHKPTIKPCMLTQAETKAFIESGVYCGQSFVVGHVAPDPDNQAGEHIITANGEQLMVEIGKKAVAVRESVAMFGARLLQDIYARPEFYYARREISRTVDELREFRKELFAIYRSQSMFSKTGCWFSNESACRATFACQYIPICFGPGAHTICESGDTPVGFKRLFTDITINGHAVEE